MRRALLRATALASAQGGAGRVYSSAPGMEVGGRQGAQVDGLGGVSVFGPGYPRTTNTPS